MDILDSGAWHHADISEAVLTTRLQRVAARRTHICTLGLPPNNYHQMHSHLQSRSPYRRLPMLTRVKNLPVCRVQSHGPHGKPHAFTATAQVRSQPVAHVSCSN